MSREKFIESVEACMNKFPDMWEEEGIEFFKAFKSGAFENEKKKEKFTEKGKEILIYLKENYENFNNMFSAKNVSEGMNIPTRSISGSLRSLVNGGYVEKLSDKPVIYTLTSLGKEVNVNEE